MVELAIPEALRLGVESFKAGQYVEAEGYFTAVLKASPNHPDGNHNMGVLAVKIGKHEAALPFLRKAVDVNPSIEQYWASYVRTLMALGRDKDAQLVVDEARSKGVSANLLRILSKLTAAKSERPKEGPPKDIIDQLINLYNRGQLANVVRLAEALAEQYPGSLFIWNMLGAAAAQSGQLDKSICAFEKMVAINPSSAEPYYNMGIALQTQGKLDDAIASYEKALSLKADYAEACNNLGVALKDRGDLGEAIASYKKALSLKPDYAEACNNMGLALKDRGDLGEAIASYKKALSLKPDYAEACNNMGLALKDQGKFDDAIASYEKALSLRPDYAEAYYNLGIAFQNHGQLNRAIASYEKVLSLRPDYAGAYNKLANTFQDQGKLDKAIACYEKALSLEPDYESARAQKLHQQAQICDWSIFDANGLDVSYLGVVEKCVHPFALLSIEDAPERHRKRSEMYCREAYSCQALAFPKKPSRKPKRIRLGYFSADFKEHPVAYLIAKVLEKHDRDQFEVFGYSLHGNKKSELRQRIINSFDCFSDVQQMSEREVALKARHDRIDIAIDLTGHMQNAHSLIFANRAAPIQINYLGFPGSMGADFIDYIIADRNLIPNDFQKFYSEKPIYLPYHYQAQNDELEIACKTPKRSRLGLPEKGFVFCAINNTYKITPREFDIWMRLLRIVKGSVLWLLESNKWAKENLIKEAAARGVGSERLVFAKRVPHSEYLAQFQCADLYLDTFNYNAGATASNALWAGLPVLTKQGKSYSARMASSLLQSVGLTELITTSESEYENLAMKLAQDPEQIAALQKKLSANRITRPLFKSELFTKHLENGYQQAYKRHCDGKLPDVISVSE